MATPGASHVEIAVNLQKKKEPSKHQVELAKHIQERQAVRRGVRELRLPKEPKKFWRGRPVSN